MSSIADQTVIFTVPDPRSVGYLVDKIVIREIEVDSIILPAITVDNALTQVLVRDPLDNSIHYNDTLAAAAITAIGPVGITPNANGMTLAANTLNLEPADATFPGVISTGAQTIPGAKTFANAATFNSGATSSVIDLPATTTTVGFIRIGGSIYMHARNNNTFLGINSGNQTTSGTNNTIIGQTTATGLTVGSQNTIVGAVSGGNITTATRNTFIGALTGQSTTSSNNTVVGALSSRTLSTGTQNTTVGAQAGETITTGGTNVLMGYQAGAGVAGGSANVVVGSNAAISLAGATNNVIIGQGAAAAAGAAISNVVVGRAAATAMTTGSVNTIIGQGAGTALTTGAGNLILGAIAGTAITNTSNNILLANPGIAGDANTTRIGAAQTNVYMAGVTTYTPAAPSNIMTIDADSRLGGGIPIAVNQPYTTSNITLLTGGVPSGDVITTMTIRGAIVLAPFPYPITYCRFGPVVMCTLPAFEVSSNTGGDQTEVRIANAIPVALRPTLFSANCAVSVQDSNNQEDVVYKVFISTSGDMIILAPNTQNLTVNWGFQEDITITYTIL